jgi:hypothetical protein
MATNINTILSWFRTGRKPTQEQFAASWTSFWHKEEPIPQASVSNLSTVLNAKTEKAQFDAHRTDTNAHKAMFDSKEDKSSILRKDTETYSLMLEDIGNIDNDLIVNYYVKSDETNGGMFSMYIYYNGQLSYVVLGDVKL